MIFLGQKEKNHSLLLSTTAYCHNQNMEGGNTEKRVTLSKTEKTRLLEFVTSTGPTQRGTPFVVQHIGSLTREFKKEHIFFMHTCSCSQEQQTSDPLSSKITFKKKLDSLSETAYCSQWIPKGTVAQSKLSLFTIQIQRSRPHPLAPNSTSAEQDS